MKTSKPKFHRGDIITPVKYSSSYNKIVLVADVSISKGNNWHSYTIRHGKCFSKVSTIPGGCAEEAYTLNRDYYNKDRSRRP
jgi:hypothetical protein